MATTTSAGSGSTKNVGGSILGLGSDRNEYNNIALGRLEHHYGSRVTLTKGANLNSVFKTTAVTLSSVADSGGGLCDFTLTSHGRSVGEYLMISGATAASLNTVHKIVSLPDANSIVTNVPYVASATAGVYQLVSGNLAKLVENAYISPFLTTTLAGLANTQLKSPAGDRNRRPRNPTTKARRLDITTWNYLTGAPTKGANAGASYNFKDADEGGVIDQSLTLAELVMFTGGKNPVYLDYA